MRRVLVLSVVLLAFMLVTMRGLAAPSLLPFDSKWTAEDVSQLIAAGAKVNETDKDGLTPLMVASKNCTDKEVIRALLDGGADVESKDKDGWTALMYAISYNSNQRVAVLLIESNSPVDDLIGGYTLADYCRNNGLLLIHRALGVDWLLFNKTTGMITGFRLSGFKEPDPPYSEQEHISIPSVIKGIPVTSIGDGAFPYCRGLNSITIPDSVTRIGDRAFEFSIYNIYVNSRNAYYLSIDGVLYNKDGKVLLRYPIGRGDVSFTIPEGVTSIGDYAFSGCGRITSITIPEGLTSLGDYAFSGFIGLENIYVDSRNTLYASINGVLYNKDGTALLWYPEGRFDTSYAIPNSVISIGEGAFSASRDIYWSDDYYRCSSLTSITIPNSVTSIGDSAFSGRSGLTSITIPNSVTSIGDKAFYGCESLASITISNSVTSIGDKAFYGCDSLASITIPNSVTSIGDEAFSYCSSLKNIYVDDSNAYYSSMNGVLYKKDKTKLLQYPEGRIDTSYTIPKGVTGIGDEAFYNCNSLASIIIPNSITSIGDKAFYSCYSLASITIPNSVTNIGDEAFYSCYSLVSITIPNSVTNIGDEAFSSCDSLKNIYVDSSNAHYSIINGVLCNKDVSKLLRYPAGRNDTSFIIPNSVTSIGDGAFGYCDSLASITIPNSVTEIGDKAFEYCDSLTSITIPNSVTEIGDWAFYGCYSLASITIPNGVTNIGEGAFFECWNLTSVSIPDSVTSIEVWDFSLFVNLKNININPNGTVYSSINGVLYNKDRNVLLRYPAGRNDTSFTIPNSVTRIGDKAFYGCESLTSITIPNSVTSIGDGAFSSCESLASITIPNSVTSIGDHAFGFCESLTSITIPNSVTRIGEDAFYGHGEDLIIYGMKDSYTKTFAAGANIRFVAIDDFFDGASNIKNSMYKVRIGPYNEKAETEKVSETLKAHGFATYLVFENNHFVQVGTFSVLANAQQLKESVESYGYPVMIKEEQEIALTIPGSGGVQIKMRLIPAGTFMMGSPESEQDRRDNEGPQHKVTISKPFYMGIYEVTQAQWAAVMGTNPSGYPDDPRNPVNYVSWDDCQEFIQELNVMGIGAFRLPTEAEWEYACRAGSTTRFPWGDDPGYSLLSQYAWYEERNPTIATHFVGQKKPNAWGLYDMHGNVSEWCNDWYNSYYAGAQTDPKGLSSDYFRVIRGGSWDYSPRYCRSADRRYVSPSEAGDYLGFRLVRTL